jgi:hypothetical protein
VRLLVAVNANANCHHDSSGDNCRERKPHGLSACMEKRNNGFLPFLGGLWQAAEEFLLTHRVGKWEGVLNAGKRLIKISAHSKPSFSNSWRISFRMRLMRRFMENHETPQIFAISVTDSSDT